MGKKEGKNGLGGEGSENWILSMLLISLLGRELDLDKKRPPFPPPTSPSLPAGEGRGVEMGKCGVDFTW